MTGKPKPRTVPDLSPEEKARRNAALEQCWRVREYLPVLERRVRELESELEETREHLEAERRAFDDLSFEATNTPDVIATRDRERSQTAA